MKVFHACRRRQPLRRFSPRYAVPAAAFSSRRHDSQLADRFFDILLLRQRLRSAPDAAEPQAAAGDCHMYQ